MKNKKNGKSSEENKVYVVVEPCGCQHGCSAMVLKRNHFCDTEVEAESLCTGPEDDVLKLALLKVNAKALAESAARKESELKSAALAKLTKQERQLLGL